MYLFIQFLKITIFLLNRCKYLNFASPSSHQHILQPTWCPIMLNLKAVHTRQFLSLHRPHINNCIITTTSSNNITLILWHMYSTSIRFQDISNILLFCQNWVQHNSTFIRCRQHQLCCYPVIQSIFMGLGLIIFSSLLDWIELVSFWLLIIIT